MKVGVQALHPPRFPVLYRFTLSPPVCLSYPPRCTGEIRLLSVSLYVLAHNLGAWVLHCALPLARPTPSPCRMAPRGALPLPHRCPVLNVPLSSSRRRGAASSAMKTLTAVKVAAGASRREPTGTNALCECLASFDGRLVHRLPVWVRVREGGYFGAVVALPRAVLRGAGA